MKCRSSLLVVTLVCLISISANLAFGQVCLERSDSELEAFARLASDWDYMHDAMMTQVGDQDHRTRFGTIVDESCLSGLSITDRNLRITRIELGLSHAIEQMHRCGQALGIVEASDVISSLRRTRINCGSLGPSGLGMMITDFNMPESTLRISATANRRFEMTLATPVTKFGEVIPGPSFENLAISDLGSVMAHEVMHVLAMNNRAWHNDISARAKFGCSNSVFVDRIYFTEAACFPNARFGAQFYADDGVYQCTDLCISALTEVDLEVIAQNLPASSLRDTAGVYGPSIVARPYPIAEATRICERVRTIRGSFPEAGR